jgi:hypothetical protein
MSVISRSIRRRECSASPALLAIRRLDGAIAQVAEHLDDQPAHDRFILDDQDGLAPGQVSVRELRQLLFAFGLAPKRGR